MNSASPDEEQRLLATRLLQLDLPAFERENALAMIRRGVFIGGLASGAWQALERRARNAATPQDEKLLMAVQLDRLRLTGFERANAQAMLQRGDFLGGLALDAWQAMGRSAAGSGNANS